MIRAALIGVAMVASAAQLTAQSFATVADTPEWSIDSAGGIPFTQISAIAATDSLIAVGDVGTKTVHLLSLSGEHRATLGREGDGPDEFRSIHSIFPSAQGGFWVADLWPSTHRLTPVSSAVSLLESVPIGHGLSGVIGLLPDGRYLGSTSPADLVDVLGVVEYPRVFHAFEPGGAIRRLSEVPGSQTYLDQAPNGMIRQLELPFLASVSATIHPDGFAVVNSRQGIVYLFDSVGRLILDIDLKAEAPPLSDATWREYVDETVDGIPESFRPEFRRTLMDVERPETWPVLRRVLADQQGHLWVEPWPSDSSPAGTWVVFSRAGERLGSVRFPTAFAPHHITDDLVVGIRRDALDVEYVESYALER